MSSWNKILYHVLSSISQLLSVIRNNLQSTDKWLKTRYNHVTAVYKDIHSVKDEVYLSCFLKVTNTLCYCYDISASKRTSCTMDKPFQFRISPSWPQGLFSRAVSSNVVLRNHQHPAVSYSIQNYPYNKVNIFYQGHINNRFRVPPPPHSVLTKTNIIAWIVYI